MIVFGHNNFKIKSFSFRDLRIPQEPGAEGIDFQVRQRYFHLFWIPFFPIGKLYVVKKKGDSNYYEMPQDIKSRIQQQGVKTPWYSFALLVLAFVGGIIFVGAEKLNDISRENRFYENQAMTKMMMKYPTTGDYYKFKAYECSNDRYNSTYVILKVNSYDEEHIEFASGYLDLLGDNQYAYSISSEIAKNNEYIYNNFTVKKENLMGLLNKEYREYGENAKIEDLGWCFEFQDMERAKLDKS
ncbi:hypothetical protein [Spongiimicrobium salis]|uniref:hypothetical protein n=1 Tax=Spongiimicrobium salis TaxID=1667022 RepID=UPI00374D4AB2